VDHFSTEDIVLQVRILIDEVIANVGWQQTYKIQLPYHLGKALFRSDQAINSLRLVYKKEGWKEVGLVGDLKEKHFVCLVRAKK